MSIDQIIAALPEKSLEALQRMRENAQRVLQSGSPAQKADAARLLEALEQQEQPEDLTPYDQLPQAEVARRVAKAFTRRPMTETDAKVLQALLNHPGTTSAHLTKVCGWKGQAWHAHFGAMCHRRLADLWPTAPVQLGQEPFYSGLFVHFDHDGARFTMREGVKAALADLGMVPVPNAQMGQ